jgi:hypothetical protein
MRSSRFLLIALLCVLVGTAASSFSQDTNFSAGPQYLLTGSPQFARPIATPTLAIESPLLAMPQAFSSPPIEHANYENIPELEGEADLMPVYYGVPTVGVVELSSPLSVEQMSALPASIAGAGVFQMTTAESLRIRGYGVTLGEHANYWKTHKATRGHNYTNQDIERLKKD